MIFYIVGTQTEIGKTIFSALLAKKLSENKKPVTYIKPVETGGEKPEDTTFLLNITKSINIYHFNPPISPHIAGKANIGKILRTLEEEKGILVVETAGGIMTPITPKYTWFHLAKEIKKIRKTHIILVAGNYLGVINHILLSFHLMEKERMKPLGFVLNSFEEEKNIAQKRQEEAIKSLKIKFFGKPITNFYLGKIPFIKNIKEKINELDIEKFINFKIIKKI